MKYAIFILIAMFSLIAVWAEDEMNATANTYNQKIKEFAQEYLHPDKVGSLNANFNYDDFLKSIEDTAKQVKITPESETDKGYDPAKHFTPEEFMLKVKETVRDAIADGKTLGDKDCEDIKKDYLYEVTFFLQGYIDDMQRGGIQDGDTLKKLSNEAYINDILGLTDSKKKECENKKNPPAASSSDSGKCDEKYKPQEHLDTVYGYTRQASAKLEFVWEGLDGFWLNRTLADIMSAFKSYFGNNQIAKADIQALEDMWPQASEVYVMNGAYANYTGSNTQNTYYVHDDGAISALDSNDANEANSREKYSQIEALRASARSKIANGKADEMTDEEKYYYNSYDNKQNPDSYDQAGSNGSHDNYAAGHRNDHCYNNRQYGYSDGTFPTIKLTTNGREYVLQQHFFTSPLVLDLDGDGKIEASRGKWLPHNYEESKVAEFDMDGDGFADLAEWVGPNDGLLLVYKGGEVSANDLFGIPGGFNDGYEKLSLLDKNNDGKISGTELATLSVWQDKNGNAKVDAGEVNSLQTLGITSISLKRDNQYVSSFEQNGANKKLWDWFPNVFTVKKKN